MLKLKSAYLPKVFDQQIQEHILGQNDSQTSWLIGRDSTCDLCLNDDAASGIHARIQQIGGQFYFSDMGSRNGTLVNERELGRNELHCLKPEDRIQVGKTLLSVDEVVVKLGSNREIEWWTNQSIVVECIGIINETPDTKTFQFCSPQWFSYLPGQFAQIEVQINGKSVKRPYTISSSPTRPEILEITVKRVFHSSNEVSVSNWLHTEFQVGDSLKLVGGAKGHFTPAPDFPDKLLLIAAGSGITPMMSIARYLYDQRSTIDVVLLYSIRTLADWTFRAEMEFIAERHPYFHPRITFTRPQANEARFGLTGRIHPALIEMIAPDWSDRTVFVCGSDGFMTTARQTFEVMEFPMERYYEESFGESVEVSASPSLPQSDEDFLAVPVEQSEESEEILTLSEAGSDEVPLVNFLHSGKSTEADAELSVLEIAEQVGANIESTCCIGRCGACKVKVCSGNIAYPTKQPGLVLTEQEKEEGYVLSCIAYPAGAVSIEA